MRHRKSGRHLKRSSSHRRALFRNLITDLFFYERIKTTEAKAKAIRGQAEKLITLAKRGQVETLVSLAQEGQRERLSALSRPHHADRLIALAEEGDDEELEATARQLALHAQRQVTRTIGDREVSQKLFDELAPRFMDRPGGYTRIVKLGPRLGDAAPMVIVELV